MTGRPSLTRQLTANFHPSFSAEINLGSPSSPNPGADFSPGSNPPPLSTTATETNPIPWWHWSVGGCTHPGGSKRPNQDSFFIWKSDTCSEGMVSTGSAFVVGVLDGHGRELGTLASQTARASFTKQLNRTNSSVGLSASNNESRERNEQSLVKKLRSEPAAAQRIFELAFHEAHAAIQKAFEDHFHKSGWETCVKGGVLLKRKCGADDWTCVHGGTTATLVVILDGHKVFSANCGDSAAVLSVCTNSASIVHNVELTGKANWPIKPHNADFFADYSPPTHSSSITRDATIVSTDSNPVPHLADPTAACTGSSAACSGRGLPGIHGIELTSTHSPEDPDEYCRMRNFRPKKNNSTLPEIRFVYDSLSLTKAKCADIFYTNKDGGPMVTNNGSYYKNVCNEWASLILSHKPDVRCFDLLELYEPNRVVNSSKTRSTYPYPFVLCIATDGVWDNWTIPALSAALLDCPQKSVDGHCTGIGETEFLPRMIRNYSPKENNDRFSKTANSTSNTCSDSSGVEKSDIDGASKETSIAFLNRNLKEAFANFGSQADNMTAVLCYAMPPRV